MFLPDSFEDLLESFSTQRARFLSQNQDRGTIDMIIAEFKNLKARGLLKPEEKDIDRYKTFDDLWDVVEAARERMSKTQMRREYKKGADLVYENDYWRVYHVRTPAAAAAYGRSTCWCVTNPSTFVNYVVGGDTIYYAISKKLQKNDPLCKIAVTVSKRGDRRFFDAEDNELTPSTFMGENLPLSIFKWRQPTPYTP
jgi:hypothetical protein